MSLSIGSQLAGAREARKITIEQASHALRIRVQYLQALEKETFDDIPSAVQARGFLRTYARYLQIDPEPLLAQMSDQPLEQSATPTASPVPAENITGSGQAIFSEIGARLRQQREMLGLSLEDVARHTHLRAHYLQALETGAINELPSPVQGRGMLNNYATFLGLDQEKLLLRFADGLQAQLQAKRSLRQVKPPTKPRKARSKGTFWRGVFSVDLIVISLLVIFILAFILWSTARISNTRSSQQPSATAPSVADILAPATATASATPSATVTPTISFLLEGETQSTPGASGNPTQAPIDTQEPTPLATFSPLLRPAVRVYIIVRQRTWMRIIIDGEPQLEGRVVTGSAYLFEGEEWIEVLTGNGAALQIFYNDIDEGSLGIFGEVVDRIYTPLGAQTPTPTITPTALPIPASTTTATAENLINP
jgi:cytoskeleton protein RodZ